jgi:hypothetical protein
VALKLVLSMEGDDEMRALIVRNWPDLAAKLPSSND